MLGLLAGAALACILGVLAPRPWDFYSQDQLWPQVMDLVRFLCTTALVLTLLLGPGIVLRELTGRRIGLALLPLPGLAILIVCGLVAWLVADSIDPQVTSFAIIGPVLGLMFGVLVGAGSGDFLTSEERRVLVLVSLALGLILARSLWSLGPEGELYEGSISRTLVPEGRPDSRTSFLVTELATTGEAPYGPVGGQIFAPYNFSSRGPLPGVAIAPIVLVTGGNTFLAAPDFAWQPYDGQGFMAYRIAMISFSCLIFLALWGLVRRLAGWRAARLAVLLAICTPFLFADLWFTWPKLLAAAFVVLAALMLVERRPFVAGLLISAGYLMHPSALLGLSALGLIALWPLTDARLRRPQVLTAILLVAGVAIGFEGWKIFNGDHYIQESFFDYVGQAYPHYDPTTSQWIAFRFHTLANTFVPMFLPLFQADSVSINRLFGHSPFVVHFFFQPWTGVPFGLGIVFFPLLLASLWRAARRWPWAIFATIVVPLVIFTVYWGASITGLLREGMQAWVLALIAVVAVQQAASGFPWLASRPVRAILSLRAVEVAALALGATLGTRGINPINDMYRLTDSVAVIAILAFSVLLGVAVWRETGALGRERPAADLPA
ncbi:MAG TPA: hypothetical protein VHQ97_01975 [Solirubrobacterales bacterium]|jgi:hypothetical protein|nr:hypothetical protein [Solirubrobacterales bacterium]